MVTLNHEYSTQNKMQKIHMKIWRLLIKLSESIELTREIQFFSSSLVNYNYFIFF